MPKSVSAESSEIIYPHKFVNVLLDDMFPNQENTISNSGNVPAFLLKLWTLVEDPTCNDLICWDSSGKSFHVTDQTRFAKEVLPHYFKHNNISSFIRQLNMYGFRKVGAVEQGALKIEKDDVEFHHSYFQRGEQKLLENIKRRTSNPKSDSMKYLHDDVSELLADVHTIKGKQDTVTSKLEQLRNENEVLWREVASLRQKHSKQQQIVNKLIQFLVTLAGGNRGLSGMKRRMQLMIEEPGSQPSNKIPKLNRALSITETNPNDNYSVESPKEPQSNSSHSGPIIHDVTDVYHNNDKNIRETTSPLNLIQQQQQQHQQQEMMPTNTSYSPISMPTEPVTTSDSSKVDSPAPYTLTEEASREVVKPDYFYDLIMHSNNQSNPTTGTISLPTSSIAPSTATPMYTNPTTCPTTDVNEHVDLTQKDLEGLKEFLASGQFNLDANQLMGLFTPETPIPNINDSMFDPQQSVTMASSPSSDSGLIEGNELMQFNAGMPFNLFDLQEEEDQNNLEIPNLSFDEGLTPQVVSSKSISTEDLD